MEIRKLQDNDISNKKVILRVDFNVEIKNGNVREKFKIKAVEETVKYLLDKSAKVALVSHLGRPAATEALAGNPIGEKDPEFSLKQIADDVENILGVKVKFVEDCIGEKVNNELENLIAGEVLLLENVRFYEGEEKNSPEFTRKLANGFDMFVNDAFSVCHRDQASITGVAKIISSSAGYRLQKEIENLDKVKENPGHPAVAIIGGAKIETKLPLIRKFEKNYDFILVGGKIANESIDRDLKFSEKVILPEDFASNKLDIGPLTIEKFRAIISSAKTIVWNGPMGKFEEFPYDHGTREILDAVVSSQSFSLIGGGESLQILEESGMFDKISFVSTGGGAMLEYLSGDPMPGIEVLKG